MSFLINLSSYSNLFFPICSFVVSIFLVVMFFSKKNVGNDETKIYVTLVIIGLITLGSIVFITAKN